MRLPRKQSQYLLLLVLSSTSSSLAWTAHFPTATTTRLARRSQQQPLWLSKRPNQDEEDFDYSDASFLDDDDMDFNQDELDDFLLLEELVGKDFTDDDDDDEWEETTLQELLDILPKDDDDDDDTPLRESAAADLEQALLQGVVPVSAGVGDDQMPGDYGFDPLQLATKDYFRTAQSFLLRLLPTEDNAASTPPPVVPNRPRALILRDYREAEIRHGRLAMLAAVFWPLQEMLDQLLLEDDLFGPLLYGPVTLPYFPLGDLDRSLEVAERLELDLKTRVGMMSTGMRQKLALAVVWP